MHSVMEANPKKEGGVSEGLLGGNRKCERVQCYGSHFSPMIGCSGL